MLMINDSAKVSAQGQGNDAMAENSGGTIILSHL
jgi:hypothetical protein